MLLKLRRKLMHWFAGTASGLLDQASIVRANLIDEPALSSALQYFDSGDFNAAYDAFHRLAQSGDPAAQYNSGVCAETGVGTYRDDSSAEKWYRKSAEQGLARAQYALTAILVADIMAGIETGLSAPEKERRLVEGYAWLLRAKTNGYPDADIAILRLSEHMTDGLIAQARTALDGGAD